MEYALVGTLLTLVLFNNYSCSSWNMLLSGLLYWQAMVDGAAERTVDFIIKKEIENWRKEYEDYIKGWIGKGI